MSSEETEWGRTSLRSLAFPPLYPLNDALRSQIVRVTNLQLITNSEYCHIARERKLFMCLGILFSVYSVSFI